MAVFLAEAAGWSALAIFGARIAGLIAGVFPIIRTLALFGLLFLALAWWQAVGIAIVAAPLLCMIERIG